MCVYNYVGCAVHVWFVVWRECVSGAHLHVCLFSAGAEPMILLDATDRGAVL